MTSCDYVSLKLALNSPIPPPIDQRCSFSSSLNISVPANPSNGRHAGGEWRTRLAMASEALPLLHLWHGDAYRYLNLLLPIHLFHDTFQIPIHGITK